MRHIKLTKSEREIEEHLDECIPVGQKAFAEIAQAGVMSKTGIRDNVSFIANKWNKFLVKTEKEPVTRVHGRTAALSHLRNLAKKGKSNFKN